MVTATFPGGTKEANRVLRHANEYPDEVYIEYKNPDGSIVARIPQKYIRITRPAERELTEEQKIVVRERLARFREKRSAEG